MAEPIIPPVRHLNQWVSLDLDDRYLQAPRAGCGTQLSPAVSSVPEATSTAVRLPSRLSIVLGTSGGSPNPRKLKLASAMIAQPIVIE